MLFVLAGVGVRVEVVLNQDSQDCDDALHRWGVAAFRGGDLHGWVWIQGFVLTCSLSDPSVRHWDRLFDSSSIKGEGHWWLVLSYYQPSPSPLDCGSSP